jgi:hypothetical protein
MSTNVKLLPAERDPLYQRICAFAIDEEPTAHGFAGRLAGENGWSRGYTARVIAEYRKFLYLCATAGVPMTPSDQVDQAWHLHLTYTRSYWERLCRDVLPAPLHHEPTRGGGHERAKFHAWYERTLAAYRLAFGSEPPADIWPPAHVRFGVDGHARRVHTRRWWVIPRPGPWLARHRASIAVASLLTAACMLLLGCNGDPATAFLSVLGLGVMIVLVVYVVARWIFGPPTRRTRGSSDDWTNTSHGWTSTFVFFGGSDGNGGDDCGDSGSSGGSCGDGGGGCGGGGCGGGGCGS